MESKPEVMALQLDDFRSVTVGSVVVQTVPGDVVVDSADGARQVLHKIQFDHFVEENRYQQVGGDVGSGWVMFRQF